jgi:hypothetical protein
VSQVHQNKKIRIKNAVNIISQSNKKKKTRVVVIKSSAVYTKGGDAADATIAISARPSPRDSVTNATMDELLAPIQDAFEGQIVCFSAHTIPYQPRRTAPSGGSTILKLTSTFPGTGLPRPAPR